MAAAWPHVLLGAPFTTARRTNSRYSCVRRSVCGPRAQRGFHAYSVKLVKLLNSRYSLEAVAGLHHDIAECTFFEFFLCSAAIFSSPLIHFDGFSILDPKFGACWRFGFAAKHPLYAASA